jgi:hypothetical protein
MRFYSVIVAIYFFSIFSAYSQSVSVYGANEISDGNSYATLKDAFDAVNATSNQSGRKVEIRIDASVTEVATAQLVYKNWDSLFIFPTQAGLSIQGNFASAIIRLQGTQNVIIDGRVNRVGITPSLLIRNQSALGGAVTVEFLTSAQFNVLRYARISGQLQDNSRGVVFIGSSSSGNGNNNNLIAYNEISGISSTERPRHAIASNGTSGRENKNNIISHNKIFNFIHASASSHGVTLISGSENFTISDNSFYEEVIDFAPTGDFQYFAIKTNSNSRHTITNNFIGGNAAEASGTWQMIKGGATAAYTFTAILVSGTSGESSIVQGNVIKNFNLTSGGASSNHDTWDGVFVESGNVIVTENIIGATTGTGSIYLEATDGSTFSTAHGILQNSTGVVTISHNSIGSVTLVGAANYSHSFEAIYVRSQANITYITSNLIGSTSTAQSIHVSSAAASSSHKQDCYGIYSASQNETYITGNTVANLHNAYAGTNTGSRTRGIRVLSGSNTVENNTIYTISSASAQAASIGATASVIAIELSASVAGTTQTVVGNTMYNLSNTNATAAEVSVWGIYFFGPTNATKNRIERNFIHSISLASTSNNSIIIGLLLQNGNTISANNIISLGAGVNRGYRIYGLWDNSGVNNNNDIYFNTIQVAGNITTGSTSVATALWNQNNNSTRNYRNNIFVNTRTLGGSSNNDLYVIRIAGTSNVTINYNNYVAGGRIGYVGNNPPRIGLSQWQTGTGQDAQSLELVPDFKNASGSFTNASDFITDEAVLLPGISIATVSNDYDLLDRLSPPKMGAFEDNNYVWVGTVSTDFGTAANWEGGVVPPNGANVYFAINPLNNCLLHENRRLASIYISNSTGSNMFDVNGNELTLGGNFNFSNGARVKVNTPLSMLVLAGDQEQSIPIGSVVDNEYAGLTINNPTGFIQNVHLTILEELVLSQGEYGITDFTLTLQGALVQTDGVLTGGETSNIIYEGTADATILPAVQLNNLTINRAAGITMTGNVSVLGILALTNGELHLSNNTLTLSGDSPTGTGSVNASTVASQLIFNNVNPYVLHNAFFGGNDVQSLILNGSGGVTSNGNFSVLHTLNLNASNPLSTKGLLDMRDGANVQTLTMGQHAVTIGGGDVTGKITRANIAANTSYAFGSQYSTILFTGGTGAQLPEQITFIVTIGSAHPSKPDALLRYYEIVRTGGSSPTRFNLNLRYLEGELNGNDKNNLVFWDHHVPYSGTSPHQHGQSAHNTSLNYMTLASHGLGYLVQQEYSGEIPWPDEEPFPTQNQTKIWIISERLSPVGDNIFVWLGTDTESPTDWTVGTNWQDNISPTMAIAASPSVPAETHIVYVPKAEAYPILPAGTTRLNYLYIEQEGELTAGTGKTLQLDYIRMSNVSVFNADDAQIEVYGALNIDNGDVSWNNTGTFNAGTSTVFFTSPQATISGSTDFYNLNISDAATLYLLENAEIGIANTLQTNTSGVFNPTFYGNTSVSYNGSGAQTVIRPYNDVYSTLILEGAGSKTMPSVNLEIQGDFTVDGTANVTAAGILDMHGDFFIGQDAVFSTSNYNHVLQGNFENNGSFTPSSAYRMSFTGSQPQYILGNTTTAFGVLELNNSNGLLLDSDISVSTNLILTQGVLGVGSNNLQVEGTISGVSETNKIHVTQESSLDLGSSGVYTVPDNVFTSQPILANLTVSADGGLVVGNQNFTVTGNLDLNAGNIVVGSSTLGLYGTTSGTHKIELSASSSLEFGGATEYVIPNDIFTAAPEIDNLIINRPGGVVLGTQPFTVLGELFLIDGNLNAEGKTLTISGEISGNNGTLGTNATTVLNISEQNDTDPPIYLPGFMFSNNLIGTFSIERTEGLYLGSQDIAINTKLILEKGILYGNGNVVIFNSAATFGTAPGNTTPGDSARYIHGCVRKIGNVAFTFPIGNEEYAPLAISEANGGGEITDYFQACYYNESPDLEGYFTSNLDEDLNSVSTLEYWILDRNNGGVNEVSVTLTWAGRSGVIGEPDDLRVARWSGVEWENKGNNSWSGDIGSGSVTSALVSNFSPFTLSSTSTLNTFRGCLNFIVKKIRR